MDKPANPHQERLEALFSRDYLPLMSCALILTQHAKAAVGTVRSVFIKALHLDDDECQPGRLFNEVLKAGPCQVAAQGYNAAGYAALGSDNASDSMPPGKRFPLEIEPNREGTSDQCKICRGMTGTDTVERWILYPLTREDANPDKRDDKVKLLKWLSQLTNNGKIVAVLGTWMGYKPDCERSGAVMSEIASLIGMDVDHTHQIWQTQNDLWNEVYIEDQPSLLDKMELWLECALPPREEIFQECLSFARLPHDFM